MPRIMEYDVRALDCDNDISSLLTKFELMPLLRNKFFEK